MGLPQPLAMGRFAGIPGRLGYRVGVGPVLRKSCTDIRPEISSRIPVVPVCSQGRAAMAASASASSASPREPFTAAIVPPVAASGAIPQHPPTRLLRPLPVRRHVVESECRRHLCQQGRALPPRLYQVYLHVRGDRRDHQPREAAPAPHIHHHTPPRGPRQAVRLKRLRVVARHHVLARHGGGLHGRCGQDLGVAAQQRQPAPGLVQVGEKCGEHFPVKHRISPWIDGRPAGPLGRRMVRCLNE